MPGAQSDSSLWGDEGGGDFLPAGGSSGGSATILPTVVGLGLVALLAIGAMGPSLRGSFLPGDDQYFIRNFSLVNRPSLGNVIRLFGIIHRDLYQPVPMVSFALDTAVFGDRAWGFHLTNLVWHVVAAGLVWTLVRLRWESGWLAGLTAGLFAIHPQAVEPVATVAARIVLMGVTFSLAAIVSFLIWSRRPTGEGGWLATAILCTVLAMMSKVQVGLPVLLLLIAHDQRRRENRTWWVAWSTLTGITVAFTLLAVYTTVRSGLAESALAHMPGPLWGRALMGMGVYLSLYFFPSGLSTWYLSPIEWRWSDPLLAVGAIGLVGSIVIAIVCYRRGSPTVARGVLWYLVGILPFLGASAARNLIAADRYTYMANIGMHWVVAAWLVFVVREVALRVPRRIVVPMSVLGSGALVVVFVAASWDHISHYRTGLAYYRRVAELYPSAPWVHLDVGWELARAGHFDLAEQAARAEMDNPKGDRARAWQLLGWIAQERGQLDVAERHYRDAATLLPKDPTTHYRLARLLNQMGRTDEAILAYQRVLELHAEHLPSLLDLAALNERLGQYSQAARYLRQVLRINPQHLDALTSLATVLLRRGDFAEAERLYREALKITPDHIPAKTNLAVILTQSGRQLEALGHYNDVLQLQPNLLSARLNRAALLAEWGRDQDAAYEYGEVLARDPGCVPALEALHELLFKASPDEGAARAVRMWELAIARAGPQPRLLAGLGWAQALAGMHDQAEQTAKKCLGQDERQTLAQLTIVLVALHRHQEEAAVDALEEACSRPGPVFAEDLDRAARAIGLYGTEHPKEPLPYYLAGRILLAQNRHELAGKAFAELMQVSKEDAVWSARVRRVMEVSAGGTTRPTTTSHPGKRGRS